MLAVGGFDVNYSQQDTTEVFDPDTLTWSSGGNMTFTHTGYNIAAVLNDGRVLVASGNYPDGSNDLLACH